MLNPIGIAVHASSPWDGMVYGRNFVDILKKWDQGGYGAQSQSPTFSWKITDGDSTIRRGSLWCWENPNRPEER